MRVLILGGTTEGRQLAGLLGARRDLAVTLSLAGRTRAPVLQGVPQAVRVLSGGFGGEEGLVGYLGAERTAAVIDATHPYAARISAHAAAAARRADIPLLALRRPPWKPVSGDRWSEVADVEGAVRALGSAPRRVFVALGRNELHPLASAPQHYYLVRSIDPVDPPLAVPFANYINARGAFDEADERALLIEHRIEIILAKNSGGSATYAKIAAARALGVAVILIRRPLLPNVPAVETVDAVLGWLDHALTVSVSRGA